MRLLTGEKFFGSPRQGEPPAAVPFRLLNPSAPLPTEQDEVDTIYAYVNHGRWMVKCPFCPSAQVAFSSDKRFFCAECANVTNGSKYIAVLWPEDAQRERIEKLLMKRGLENRNWVVGETISQLESENTSRGII